MSDFYEKATVNTMIPQRLVTPLERALLSGCGFACDEDGANLYFYAQNAIDSDNSALRIHDGDLKADHSALGAAIRKFLKRQRVCAGAGGYIEHDIPSEVVSWDGLFQDILCKPENRGPGALTEIVVMGAYTCSKMAPEGFGGWVTRITKKHVQSAGTQMILDRMRKSRGRSF